MHHELTSCGLPAQIHLLVFLPQMARDPPGARVVCTLSRGALKGKDPWASCLAEMHKGVLVLPTLGTKRPE